MSPYSLLLLLANFAIFSTNPSQVSGLSPPHQDFEWLGWWCNSNYGVQGGKCILVLPPSTTSTFDDAEKLCSAEHRNGDLFTPTLLQINSKEEEDSVVGNIMWGAYLWEGGDIKVWVGRSRYTDSILTQGTNGTTMTTDQCHLLQINVAPYGSEGQPSGYGFNPKNVSWVQENCSNLSRVVCQTEKVTVKGLLEGQRSLRLIFQNLRQKYEESRDELTKLRSEHCGVEPKDRVECGWGGIKQWQCLQRGCCFDKTITGVKWCFKKSADRSKFIN